MSSWDLVTFQVTIWYNSDKAWSDSRTFMFVTERKWQAAVLVTALCGAEWVAGVWVVPCLSCFSEDIWKTIYFFATTLKESAWTGWLKLLNLTACLQNRECVFQCISKKWSVGRCLLLSLVREAERQQSQHLLILLWRRKPISWCSGFRISDLFLQITCTVFLEQ